MLTIADLSVKSRDGKQLLSNVSLRLDKGECVGLTGASGAGKTTLIRTIMGTSGKQLLISGGDIQADGKSILEASYKERRAMCGRYFGFIPQNSMTSFFSNVKIGKQIIETYRLNLSMTAAEAHELAAEMLRLVNLSDTDRVMSSYPGQLSGGMLQRVAMSIVLGIKPTYLLADEPTSALDRDNRALLTELLSGYKDGGILFISHDAEAIVSLCSSVCDMEHGRIVESKETGLLFRAPQHPWTKAFVNAAERSRRENAEALCNLTSMKKSERYETILRLMVQMGLSNNLLSVPVRALSGGEQRRLGLLRALAVRPKFLVLDEVTAGLDLITTESILDLLAEYKNDHGCSYMLITHDFSAASRLCSRMFEIEHGQIIHESVQ